MSSSNWWNHHLGSSVKDQTFGYATLFENNWLATALFDKTRWSRTSFNSPSPRVSIADHCKCSRTSGLSWQNKIIAQVQYILSYKILLSFLMRILNKIILIYEVSFVTPVQELKSCVSSIVSEASFSECLNRYLQSLMVIVHIIKSYQVKINGIEWLTNASLG